MRLRFVTCLVLLASFAALGTLPSSAARPNTNGAPGHTVMTDDGPLLVTPTGMSLYMLGEGGGSPFGPGGCTDRRDTKTQDPAGGFGMVENPRSDVTKSCLDVSPPYFADAQARPQGDWTLIDRPGGRKQWAYKGRALHLSVRDKVPGDRNGIEGGVFARFFGGGMKLALMTDSLGFPPGFELTTLGEDLVIGSTLKAQPVYTPKGKTRRACDGCASFQPVLAPALAKANRDWAIVDAGIGRRQYAYRGKPLYFVPPEMTALDVEELGDWEPVVFRKGTGTPPEIGRQMSLLGEVYTDKSGKTLYTFGCIVTGCELPGGPARYWVALCSTGKECSRRWRPYIAGPNARPVGNWSIVEVADPVFSDQDGLTYGPELPRVRAWAHRGVPVYTYYLDKEPREITGHMIRWTGNRSQFTALRVPGRDTTGSGF